MTLIVAAEVHGRAAMQGQFRHAADLRPVIDAARIFTPRAFLGIPEEV